MLGAIARFALPMLANSVLGGSNTAPPAGNGLAGAALGALGQAAASGIQF